MNYYGNGKLLVYFFSAMVHVIGIEHVRTDDGPNAAPWSILNCFNRRSSESGHRWHPSVLIRLCTIYYLWLIILNHNNHLPMVVSVI